VQTNERLLDQVLGSVAIVGEEAGEAHQRWAFLVEESLNELVGMRRLRANGSRPRREGRLPIGDRSKESGDEYTPPLSSARHQDH
jgi:hypothetical protein